MSIFSKIMGAIFGTKADAAAINGPGASANDRQFEARIGTVERD